MRILLCLLLCLLCLVTVGGQKAEEITLGETQSRDVLHNPSEEVHHISVENEKQNDGLLIDHVGDTSGEHNEHPQGVHLVSWRWRSYSRMIMFTAMIICAILIKIGFHHTKYLSRLFPESCVLILLGILLAVINHYVLDVDKLEDNPYPKFTADLFFNVLLPPVILDASFALYDRDFASNFSSVLTFAVVGTLFNVFTVGFSLYGLLQTEVLGEFDQKLSAVQCLIFSSLISAVDPVAVLAIFEEIHVNASLYFLVFGESLLNDGVTVVLYNTMISIEGSSVGWVEVIMALLSFLCVVLGGFSIGMFLGSLASLATRFTNMVRVVEPLLVLSFGYLAFLLAELVHWSGIISIIGYGLVVRRYAFTNISQKSYTTVKYATKTLSSLSDCIIFLFLGIVLITEQHTFHLGFIIATIFICTLTRFVGTFMLSGLVNLHRTYPISIEEQFIMAYGGLRGAVGFSLACVLAPDLWYRQLFLSTALVMVFFTVFLQGSSIKLLVKLFRIRLKSSQTGPRLLSPYIQEKLMDDMMAGMEVVVGRQGTYSMGERMRHVDQSCLRGIFLSKEKREGLEREYEKVLLDTHFTNLYGASVLVGNMSQKGDDFTPSQDIKTFKRGVKTSDWGMFKNKFNREIEADEVTVRNQMEQRLKRKKDIESRILQSERGSQAIDRVRDWYREGRQEKKILLNKEGGNPSEL